MAASDYANLPRSAAGNNNPWLIAVIVSIATFMEVLDTTIANVALRHIAGSLAASQDESTYIVTSYLVSNAIILPISGWLANVLGRKRFYMICVALFTVSSVMCAFSTSLWMMLVFRVLQGMGGGGLAPVEQSIFADTFPPAKRAMAFALYGFTVVTAPAIGPMLGGWLTDNYSWHWVFLINLPVGIVSLVLTSLFVVDSPAMQAERQALLKKGLRIDYVGFALIVVGIGALQIVLDRFERLDGFSSNTIVILTVTAAVCIITLIVWELLHPQPVFNVRLLAIRPFGISCVVMFMFGLIIISTTQLLPQLTQQLLGYDATTAGLTLAFGGLVSIVVMPITGMITGRVVQAKWLVFASLLGTAGALNYAGALNLNISFWDVSLSRGLQVFWLPLVFIPLSAVQFTGIPPARNNEASAIINFMRNMGGSVGVSIATTKLQWNQQIHSAYLGEHITPYNGYGFGVSLTQIFQTVQNQAIILSYLDVFRLLAIVMLVVSPLALFLPKAAKGATGAH